MMIEKRLLVIAAVTVLMVTSGACGGSSNPGGTDTAERRRWRWRNRWNRVYADISGCQSDRVDGVSRNARAVCEQRLTQS